MNTTHLPIPTLSASDVQRFESHRGDRDPKTGCEPWTGTLTRSRDRDRGTFTISSDGRAVNLVAARVGYLLAHGEDPGEFTVEHECANPVCVRGSHLGLLTRTANVMADTSNCAGRVNRDKTHCVHGHEFSTENTRIQIDGRGRTSRSCIACRRLREAHRAEARRAARPVKVVAPPQPCWTTWSRTKVRAGQRGDLGADGWKCALRRLGWGWKDTNGIETVQEFDLRMSTVTL